MNRERLDPRQQPMKSYFAIVGAKVQAANKRLKSAENKDNSLHVAVFFSPVAAGRVHMVSPLPAWIVFSILKNRRQPTNRCRWSR
jgi:hypothetical protein